MLCRDCGILDIEVGMASAYILETFHWWQRMVLRVPLRLECVFPHCVILVILKSVHFGPQCGFFAHSALCTLVLL